MAFEWTAGRDRFRISDDGHVEEWYPPEGGAPGLWHPALQGTALFGLRAAVAVMETYRKALEPFAREWVARWDGDVATFTRVVLVPSRDEQKALQDACKLLGIEVPGEET